MQSSNIADQPNRRLVYYSDTRTHVHHGTARQPRRYIYSRTLQPTSSTASWSFFIGVPGLEVNFPRRIVLNDYRELPSHTSPYFRFSRPFIQPLISNEITPPSLNGPPPTSLRRRLCAIPTSSIGLSPSPPPRYTFPTFFPYTTKDTHKSI